MIAFSVNDERVEVDASPVARLLDVLREDLRLTGTKEGCGEGECGACTVLLNGEPVLACLVPLVQVQGGRVDTIEGLASGQASPLFKRLVEAGGVQCGACTPGIAVTAWALLLARPHPTREQVQEALAGNLCRCTGYESIIRAVLDHAASGGPAV